MRGFVAAGLVVFHSAVAFASGASWFVTDPRPSRGFTVFLPWGSLPGMPLLFLISAMGTRYAMRTRSAAAFAPARLLVPFASGLVLLVPPMFYIEGLGGDGAEILVHGRDAGRGSVVAGTITAEGGKARFAAADLTDPAQVDHLAEQAGPIDVLASNAGFSWFGPTADLDVATFDRLVAANVRAAYFLVAALAPKMAARAAAASSASGTAGQIGLAGGAAYGATKATLAAMTRSWAAEFSPSGVRVNAIAAGPVRTNGAAPDRIEASGAATLLARPAEPGEIASVIAFLASPKASYITGAVIAADGGRTAI
jgi:NAD(P)-dependent dehydrogenase (short-subunit alcohol dehydrogenase family)